MVAELRRQGTLMTVAVHADMTDRDAKPTQDAILSNLQSRYHRDLPYTRVGPDVLVAVNPYKTIVETKKMKRIDGDGEGEVEEDLEEKKGEVDSPCLQDLARSAWWHMVRGEENQSIIARGESGSGKSESIRRILAEFSVLSSSAASSTSPLPHNPHDDADLTPSDLLTCSATILDMFGNASTRRNLDSSRYGRVTEVRFDETGILRGAQTFEYLLERDRTTASIVEDEGDGSSRSRGASGGGSGGGDEDGADEERNFHVFYALVKGADREERRSWRLNDSFACLPSRNRKHCDRHGGGSKTLADLRRCLRSLRFGRRARRDVFRLLAAILHIGNIRFVADRSGDDVEGNDDDDDDAAGVSDRGPARVRDREHLHFVAELLEVSASALEDAVTTRATLVGRNLCTAFLRPRDAERQRDHLACALYGLLFSYVVERINLRLSDDTADGGQRFDAEKVRRDETTDAARRWITLVDMPGFEDVGRNNGLHQFASNFASEKIRQYSATALLSPSTHLSRVEEFDGDNDVDVEEEGSKNKLKIAEYAACVNLYADQTWGLIHLLDDRTLMRRSSTATTTAAIAGSSASKKEGSNSKKDAIVSDEAARTLVESFDRHHGEGENRYVPSSSSSTHFGVQHYVATVTYDALHFVDANRNAVSADIIKLFRSEPRRRIAEDDGDDQDGGKRVEKKRSGRRPFAAVLFTDAMIATDRQAARFRTEASETPSSSNDGVNETEALMNARPVFSHRRPSRPMLPMMTPLSTKVGSSSTTIDDDWIPPPPPSSAHLPRAHETSLRDSLYNAQEVAQSGGIFVDDDDEKGNGRRRHRHRHPHRSAGRTLLSDLRISLADLCEALDATRRWHVICINPNARRRPDDFDFPKVLAQVVGHALSDLVRAKRIAPWTVRMKFDGFAERYGKLLRGELGDDAGGVGGDAEGESKRYATTNLREPATLPLTLSSTTPATALEIPDDVLAEMRASDPERARKERAAVKDLIASAGWSHDEATAGRWTILLGELTWRAMEERLSRKEQLGKIGLRRPSLVNPDVLSIARSSASDDEDDDDDDEEEDDGGDSDAETVAGDGRSPTASYTKVDQTARKGSISSSNYRRLSTSHANGGSRIREARPSKRRGSNARILWMFFVRLHTFLIPSSILRKTLNLHGDDDDAESENRQRIRAWREKFTTFWIMIYFSVAAVRGTIALSSLACPRPDSDDEEQFYESESCRVVQIVLVSVATTLLFAYLGKMLFDDHRRRRTDAESLLENPSKPCVIFLPCCDQRESALRKTIESIARSDYPVASKLLFVVVDGMVRGCGSSAAATSEIILDLLGVDESRRNKNEDAYEYNSVGGGKNKAKVYAGVRDFGEGRRVSFLVVVKSGLESETTRPGRRGERDSRLVLMRFLNKVNHRERMSPLEITMARELKDTLGGDDAGRYELCVMTKPGAVIARDGISILASTMTRDPKLVGVCGETVLSKGSFSWAAGLRRGELFASQHLRRNTQSMFGAVTRLPSNFSMFRIKTTGRKEVPFLCAPELVSDYGGREVDTLHKRHLLREETIGSDRYLTTLLLKHFPLHAVRFVPRARCFVPGPKSVSAVFRRRRRDESSAVHNLVELLRVSGGGGSFFDGAVVRLLVLFELLSATVAPALTLYFLLVVYDEMFSTGTVPDFAVFVASCPYVLSLAVCFLRGSIEDLGWMFLHVTTAPFLSLFIRNSAFWHMDDSSLFSSERRGVYLSDRKEKQGESSVSSNKTTWDRAASIGDFAT